MSFGIRRVTSALNAPQRAQSATRLTKSRTRLPLLTRPIRSRHHKALGLHIAASAPTSSSGQHAALSRLPFRLTRPLSAMPTTAPHSAKVNTAASAWSRLVRLTQTASKTSRTDAVKGPQRSESLPAKRLSPTSSERPVKLRRLTTQSVSSSSRQPSSLISQQRFSLDPFQPEADCIEVCPCQEGDPCLPDGKCSFSRLSNADPASASPTHSAPESADLHPSWAGRMKGQEEVSKGGQDVAAQSPDYWAAGAEIEAQDAVAKINTLSRRTPHVLRENTEEENLEDQSAQQPTGDADKHMVQLEFKGKQPAYTADSPPRVARATPVSKPRRIMSGARYRTDQDDDESNEQADTEELRTTTAIQGTPHTATPSLQEGSQDRLNRVSRREPQITQLATPTSSQESTPPALISGNEENELAPAPKTKRRLTLHGSSFETQHATKKRKTPPKRKQAVQTTLSLAIGGSAGMRECKVCDTVYNPFHPEDIKVHAKRHAGVLKLRIASA